MAGAERRWSRRRLLSLTVSAGGFVIAGCVSENSDNTAEDDSSSEDGGDSSSGDSSTDESGEEDGTEGDTDLLEDPKGVTKAFFDAYQNGDVERMQNLLHGESPLTSNIYEEDAEEYASVNFEEITSEIVEESEGAVTLEVSLTVAATDGDGSRTATGRVDLKASDDEWTVWNVETERGQIGREGPRVPKAAFEFEAEDGEAEITHTSGESIRADRLRVEGNDLTRQGGWVELGGTTNEDADGNPTVSAGNVLTVGFDGSAEITLVWDGEEDAAVIGVWKPRG